MLEQAQWIWTEPEEGKDTYGEFYSAFAVCSIEKKRDYILSNIRN